MTEDYDVFGKLDELCNKNLLANLKSAIPPLESKSDENSPVPSPEALLENYITFPANNVKPKKGKTKKNKDVIPSESATLPKESDLNRSQAHSDLTILKHGLSTLQAVEEEEVRITRAMLRQNQSLTLRQCEPQPLEAPCRGRKNQTQSHRKRAEPQAQLQPLNNMEYTNDVSGTNQLQQLQSRREVAALIAAQSTNVSYVDLVSSPVPRIEGVIVVDSDEEQTEQPKKAVGSWDLSFEEENPEISVKIMWNGHPEIFKLRKHQKFAHIFTTIAEREGTDEKNLVFNVNSKIITPNDTPASINYKIFQFIYGRVFFSRCNLPKGNEKKKRDLNKISLKIQSDQWKRPLQIDLLKTEKFKILYIKCAEELNIPYENLKLSFDGETLEFNDSPADLDLEGGEAIDLRIKK